MARPDSYTPEEWFYRCLIERAKIDLHQTVPTQGRLLIALETAAWWASTKGQAWISLSGADLPDALRHIAWADRARWLLAQADARDIKVPTEIATVIHLGLDALEEPR